MSNVAARPLSRRAIRSVAKIFHKITGTEKYFDIIDFLEHYLPVIDQDFVFEIVEDYKLPDAYAQAFPERNTIQVRESVYIGAVSGNGRDRFTLCHELGHYIFHGNENISYLRSDKMLEAYRDPEWQANTFAGEILVPEKVAQVYKIEAIKKLCKVSYTVAKIQKSTFLKQKNSHQTASKFGGVAN